MTSSEPQSAKEALFSWLRHLNKYKGSDLFVTTNFPPAMKVDGKIVPITEEPLTAERCMEIAFNIMSPKQIEEFTNTNECNFAISLPDTSRFRVNAMVQRGATALVLLEWAWGRIAATPGSATARWQDPAHALRTWVLPEFDMRLAIVRQRLSDAAALQDKSIASA